MNQSFSMENMQEIMYLQQLQERMETLSKQLEEIQEKQNTIMITLGALDELGSIKEGSEILAPIADGIFVKTKLIDSSKAIVNVGRGITVEKSISDVLEMVKKHEVGMAEKSLMIESEMQSISNNILEKINQLEMKETSTNQEN